MTHDGKFIATPHILIKTKYGNVIKIGKHALKQRNGVVVGITYTSGNMGKPTILHVTDISAVKPVGFIFTRSDIKERNEDK